ncbi:MAG: cryptochrome/photolyase family protein [Rhodospirillales bacterium]
MSAAPVSAPVPALGPALGPVIVWFRDDLRLADNPALAAAARAGCPVLPLYILDEETPGLRPLGGAARWRLHHSLKSLAADLSAHGINRGLKLILRRGAAKAVLAELCAGTQARAVYWNRRYDAAAIECDTAVKTDLKAAGAACKSFQGFLMAEPWTIRTKQGGFYKVFSRFWDAFCAQGRTQGRAEGGPERPLGAAPRLNAADVEIESDDLDSWGLLPAAPDWAEGLRETWTPGESGAHAALDNFLEHAAGYGAARDLLGAPGVSNLSAHLRFGEIDPRRVWFAVLDRLGPGAAADAFLRQLAWRDFAWHVLHHVPSLPTAPLDARFENFPWAEDEDLLNAWRRGRTGYPTVDAGMRELWRTGAMHNRARMICASFLVKHLMQPWRAGEAWFWDTLVDADLAANTFNWQWTAGCGADAAPYFRIFNPTLQGRKFDADGAYVRRWIPELMGAPDKWLHEPWNAPESVRDEITRAGYPPPVVDHKYARERALAAFQKLKG